jgi:hypothetical protein
MPTLTIEYQTDAERLVLEQAIGDVRGLHQLALSAAHGTVLAACEQRARTDGRELLRDTLATALQPRRGAVAGRRPRGTSRLRPQAKLATIFLFDRTYVERYPISVS